MSTNNKKIYSYIYENLLEQILNGTYPVDEYLPSEAELENQYNYSRTPIRRALNQLKNEGYIVRVQGKGSLVVSKHPNNDWNLMTGFQHNYSIDQVNQKKIRAKTLSVKKIKNSNYNKELNLIPSVDVTYLQRVRYFNNEPIIYMEHFIIPSIPIDIFKRNLEAISINELFRDYCEIKVERITEQIEAVNSEEKHLFLLDVEIDTPLLLVKRVTYSVDDRPVEINKYYVKTDNWKYTVEYQFKGEQL